MDTLRNNTKKFPDWRYKRFKIHYRSCWSLSLLKQFSCALIYRSFHHWKFFSTIMSSIACDSFWISLMLPFNHIFLFLGMKKKIAS